METFGLVISFILLVLGLIFFFVFANEFEEKQLLKFGVISIICFIMGTGGFIIMFLRKILKAIELIKLGG